MALLKGFLVGLSMVLFVGPVFFTLLQISLSQGFKSGFFVALGIFLSDVIAATLCYFGAGAIIQVKENTIIIGVLGTIILLFIGFAYIFKPKVNHDVKLKQGGRSYLGYVIKGFLVNFVNPFVFAVWITITGYAQNEPEWSVWEHVIFLSTALIMILTTDSLKAMLANRISKYIRPSVLKIVFRVIGVLMVLSSFRIIYEIYPLIMEKV